MPSAWDRYVLPPGRVLGHEIYEELAASVQRDLDLEFFGVEPRRVELGSTYIVWEGIDGEHKEILSGPYEDHRRANEDVRSLMECGYLWRIRITRDPRGPGAPSTCGACLRIPGYDHQSDCSMMTWRLPSWAEDHGYRF